MSQISVKLEVAVLNGPALGFNRTMDVQGIDMLDVVVPSGAADQAVDLQPGGAGKVKFIIILSTLYSTDLSYKANAAGGTARKLNEPHLFYGSGAVAMLDPAPTKLLWSNATAGPAAKDAHLQILVGRDA